MLLLSIKQTLTEINKIISENIQEEINLIDKVRITDNFIASFRSLLNVLSTQLLTRVKCIITNAFSVFLATLIYRAEYIK